MTSIILLSFDIYVGILSDTRHLNYNGAEREYSMVCAVRNTPCLLLGDVFGINCCAKVGGLVGLCANRRTVLQDSWLPFRRIGVGVGVGVGIGFVSKGRTLGRRNDRAWLVVDCRRLTGGRIFLGGHLSNRSGTWFRRLRGRISTDTGDHH